MGQVAAVAGRHDLEQLADRFGRAYKITVSLVDARGNAMEVPCAIDDQGRVTIRE